MFAEAARRLIIVDDVDDVADDPNPLEKRSGDRHSTAFGRGLDPKSQMGRSSTLLTGVAAVLIEAAVVEPVDPFGGGVICPHRRVVSTWWPPTANSTMRCPGSTRPTSGALNWIAVVCPRAVRLSAYGSCHRRAAGLGSSPSCRCPRAEVCGSGRRTCPRVPCNGCG